ncbi:hypothetical protein CH340_22945 [Rhodoplanes serenus]|nr:hypothetical protein CH340_22945 [Rhodoplanes serenus]
MDVLALHDGGPTGLRDRGLLLSALARPRHLTVYGEQADLIDLASAYTAGIAAGILDEPGYIAFLRENVVETRADG